MMMVVVVAAAAVDRKWEECQKRGLRSLD